MGTAGFELRGQEVGGGGLRELGEGSQVAIVLVE